MRIVRLSIVLLVCVFSTFTLAARARQKPVPSNRPVGLYIGVGIGVNSLTASHSSVQLDDYYPVSYKSRVNGLFPSAQIGFWGRPRYHTSLLWGFKAFYRYLDVNASYLMNANEPYNNHDTHVSQETGLLFNLGFQYLRKVFPYFGVGLMWLPKVEDIYYDNDSGDANKKKSMLGGMVQLGVLYTLSPHWFLDVVYSCGITGSKLFNMANVDGDPINSKVRVFSQDVMIGINLQFSS